MPSPNPPPNLAAYINAAGPVELSKLTASQNISQYFKATSTARKARRPERTRGIDVLSACWKSIAHLDYHLAKQHLPADHWPYVAKLTEDFDINVGDHNEYVYTGLVSPSALMQKQLKEALDHTPSDWVSFEVARGSATQLSSKSLMTIARNAGMSVDLLDALVLAMYLHQQTRHWNKLYTRAEELGSHPSRGVDLSQWNDILDNRNLEMIVTDIVIDKCIHELLRDVVPERIVNDARRWLDDICDVADHLQNPERAMFAARACKGMAASDWSGTRELCQTAREMRSGWFSTVVPQHQPTARGMDIS